MRYREFVEALQGELESRLGEAAVTFQKVTKNNEVTKDCFLISESGYDISPAVYIEEYYREFRDGMSLKEAADRIRDRYLFCYRINGYSRWYLLECIAIEAVKMILG